MFIYGENRQNYITRRSDDVRPGIWVSGILINSTEAPQNKDILSLSMNYY